MPRKGQTTALERPTGVRGSIQEQPIKPPRNKKRVADENVESNAKTRKRAAFGDLTNVSNFLFSRKTNCECTLQYIFVQSKKCKFLILGCGRKKN